MLLHEDENLQVLIFCRFIKIVNYQLRILFGGITVISLLLSIN